MSNKVTKVLDIGLDLQSLSAAVKKANELIENMGKKGSPPKGLISSFDKIDRILDKMAVKTKDGVFKGTDAEYASLIRELGSVGEEFEHIDRIIKQLGKMDDDALSKFLKKEDLKVFKDSTKALKEYYEIVKKLETGDSSVLTEAKKGRNKATKNKEEAQFRRNQRAAALQEKQQAAEKTGVFGKRKTAEKVSAEYETRKGTLESAKSAESASQKKVADLQKQIDALTKQQAKEQESVGTAEKKVEASQAKLHRTEAFYSKPSKDGTMPDKAQDYGDISFAKATAGAEEAKKALEAKKAAVAETTSKLAELTSQWEIASKELEENSKKTQDAEKSVNDYTATYNRYTQEREKAETAAEAELKALREAQEELKKAESELRRYTIAEQDAATAVKVASEEKTEAENKAKDLTKAYENLYSKAQELGINLDELGVSQKYSEDSAKKLTNAIENNKKAIVDNIRVAGGFETTLKETGQVLDENRDKTEKAAEAQKKLNAETAKREDFENKIKEFLGMAGAAQVLRSALHSAMDTIKELDATMTEMSVVTNLSVGDYWDQLPEYTARANELGLAINDVYKADTLFYQQGLKTNEVMEISTETMKMAKIAGLDTAEATDRMTAALRGFNMELDKASAQKVSDVYSELAAITAADVEEISSAMTKTASIASSAGMEFETTAAFLSQIIETTRESAETAGTAMKTVIARFQELKKAPDEIGEIDGEIVDANAIETALRSVGVSLRDAGGQFRELDDVFLELSSKWDTLDKNTQRYIATIAAGSRQQSRFIAMMSDYSRTQDLVTAANNSAGASARQYEKTTESLQTKLTRLKNAWDEFAMGILESDLVKTGVEILTKFLEIINKATSAFDGLGGSIAKIMTILMIFKFGAKLFEKLKQPLMNVFDWAVSMASPKGYEAGKKFGEEFARGSKEAIEAAEKQKEEEPKDNQEEEQKPEEQQKTSIGVTIAQKSGWADIDEGRKKRKQARDLQERSKTQPIKKARYDSAAENFDKIAAETTPDTEEYQKALEELVEAQADYNAELDLTQEELDSIPELAKEGTEKMASGFAKMGEAAIGAGVGISMLGGLLSSLGLEEVGEGISWFGNMLTMAGTAVTAIIPVIKLLSAALVKGGISAQAAWWWAIAIVAAVAALVIGIIAIANAVKNASPEAKLERAQEAANKAADAADRATESYENLKEAFEGLENGYKALENLTRGTEEWNDAVNDINNSVLDLIAQYPALAALVENEGGVLTIDINSDEAQAILDKAKDSAIIARNNQTMAALQISQAEDDVAYKNLDDNAKFGLGGAVTAGVGAGAGATLAGAGAGAGIGALVGSMFPVIGTAVGAAVGAGIGAIGGAIGGYFSGEAAKDAALEDTQKTTEQLAKAIASGAIIDDGSGYQVKDKARLTELGIKEEELDNFYAEVGDSTAELREFGNQLLETEKQSEAAFGALAVSAMQLANTLGFTEEEQLQATNIVDDATTKRFYDEQMKNMEGHDFTSNKLDENQKKKRDEAIKAQYGADARIDGNKVTYRDAEGKQQTEELTSDEMKAITANYVATTKAADAIERTPEVLDKVGTQLGFAKDSAERKAFDAATQDKTGQNLTADQAKTMAELNEAELLAIWEGMDLKDREIFGNVSDFIEKTKGAGEIAAAAFEDARISAEQTGAEVKAFMTSDMAKGFTKKMEEVFAVRGPEAVAQIQEAYNKLIAGQTDEVAQEITALMNGIDWTNQEELLGLQIQLEEEYGYSREAAKEMTDAMVEATGATSSLTEAVKAFGKLYQITQKMNAAIEKASNLQWEYERLLNSGADATELSANIEQRRQALLTQGNTALEAYNQAIEDMHDTYTSGYSVAGKDLTNYVKFDKEIGAYDVSELQRQIDAGMFGGEGSDGRKAVEDYVSKLEEANETAKDQLDTAKDAYEQLEEIEQIAQEAYYGLYEQIAEALILPMEKSIAVQEEILDATETANGKIVGAIQEQINADRQARENEKTEENIDKLRQQQAYLGMDTSGANSLQLAELDQQIKEEEQSYQDTLIDQSLQQLQDANDYAAQQRERQIVLAEAQLEAYKMSDQYQLDTQSMLDTYLAEYRAHVEQVQAYEQNQALREEYANLSADEQIKAQDAYNMTFEEYKTHYTSATEDEYNRLGELYGATQDVVDKPGPFEPQQTGLGQFLKNIGFTEGLGPIAEQKLWDDLEEQTALAASGAQGTDDNTGGDSENDANTLLEGIQENTSAENLAKIQLGSEYAGAKAKAQSFTAATGIKITDTAKKDAQGNAIFTDSDGKIVKETADYINSANALSNYSEKVTGDIKASNSRAINTYKTIKDAKGKNILNQDDYYAKLQAGQIKGYTWEGFLKEMSDDGSSEASYESYLNREIKPKKEDAISKARKIFDKGAGGDYDSLLKNNQEFKGYYDTYLSYGGTANEFKKEMVKDADTGGLPGAYAKQDGAAGKSGGVWYTPVYISGGGLSEGTKVTVAADGAKDVGSLGDIKKRFGNGENGWVVMYRSKPYVHWDGQWRGVDQNPNTDVSWNVSNQTAYNHLTERFRNGIRKYKTGGVADFTGPAWLDGTPSKPEYVLNSAQTERFFSLIDVLEKYDTDESKQKSGDNYFDIEINVEKLENDYDVEKLANKIRSMIYNDATYRNVNAINLIR